MAEQNRESSMEEILSSIKRIIAEDKSVEGDAPAQRRKSKTKPALQAVPDPEPADEEILELTNEVADDSEPSTELSSSAQGVFGDRRKEPRLIDDQKLNSMRQSLSALVAMEDEKQSDPAPRSGETSLEELTRELMRPMLKQWLDDNLPSLVEELVAREIQRLSEN